MRTPTLMNNYNDYQCHMSAAVLKTCTVKKASKQKIKAHSTLVAVYLKNGRWVLLDNNTQLLTYLSNEVQQ